MVETMAFKVEKFPAVVRERLEKLEEVVPVKSPLYRQFVMLALAVGMKVLQGEELGVLYSLEKAKETGEVPELLLELIESKTGLKMTKEELEGLVEIHPNRLKGKKVRKVKSSRGDNDLQVEERKVNADILESGI